MIKRELEYETRIGYKIYKNNPVFPYTVVDNDNFEHEFSGTAEAYYFAINGKNKEEKDGS